MNEPVLPGLPEPFRRQGQQICNDGNDKVFCNLFAPEQVRALQIATWKAARDYFAQLTHRKQVEECDAEDTAYNCACFNVAAAIRRSPDPVEVKC